MKKNENQDDWQKKWKQVRENDLLESLELNERKYKRDLSRKEKLHLIEQEFQAIEKMFKKQLEVLKNKIKELNED